MSYLIQKIFVLSVANGFVVKQSLICNSEFLLILYQCEVEGEGIMMDEILRE